MLKFNKSILLAASLALAATSATAAPASAHSGPAEWTYWTAPSLAPNAPSHLAGCTTEVAKVHPNGDEEEFYLHRTPSSSACVPSSLNAQTRLLSGREEVVLFKPEALVLSKPADPYAMSWMDRALQTLMVSSFSRLPDEFDDDDSGQISFDISTFDRHAPRLLTATNYTLLLTLTPESLSTIDERATGDTRIQRLVFHPLSSVYQAASDKPKPEPKFKKPKYNSVVAKIASSSALNPARILQDLRILTGEAAQPKDVGEWHSRHSATHGARLAGKWVQQQLEHSLAPFNGSWCEQWEYSPYFAPNIVCHIPSSHSATEQSDEGTVIVSAHYDSRGTFGSTTAPGGDDDASGTSALLAIARTLGSSQVALKSPVQLIAFSGEEQGLVGSSHYAKHLADTSASVKLALQMDMLAYRVPGEPMQLAFPDKLATVSATAHVAAVADIYAPELEQGYTPACCSDHQSFWENAFPATWVFERNGPIADPMYHNSGDVTNRTGYDVDQLAAIAKVVTATLLDVAGFHF